MTVGTIITFRHPILRSVVYDSAAEGLRRTVHLAVAEELTAASERDRQIWHLAAGATHLDEDLAGQLDDLGRRAALRAASTVASTAFERAARWSPTSAAARSRLVAAAGAAWDGGQRERALTLLDEAEPAEGAMTPSGSRLRARIVTRSGSLREGLVLLERAAEVAGPDDRVRLLAEACHACMYLADMRSLRRIELQLSTSLSQAAESDARGVGMVASGAALVLLGEDGTPRLRAALPLLADRSTVPWSMLALLFLRDTEHGGELRRLVDDARTHVGVGALPSLLFHLARDQATARSWERAEANYDESARLARETGQGAELAMSLAGRACLESRRGRDDTCRAYVQEALELCRERSLHFGEIWCELAVGDLDLSQGSSQEAARRYLALAERLREDGVRDPDLHPGPELVDALMRVGKQQEAVGAAHGVRLRRAGRRVDARRALRQALVIFDEVGAATWADVTRAEIGATGEKVPPRQPTGPGALTPQELQVCLLLAEGRTTREAAAALFLSPKTVEYHLRKVYLKLDIHSRSELATVMHSMN